MFYNLDKDNNIINPSVAYGNRTSNINYQTYILSPERYYIYDINTDDVIVNPNFEIEQEQTKQKQFEKDFFQTSLGFVRRKVLMKTGETKDFLFDIKPTLKIDIPILTYNQDGTQNIGVLVTQAFLDECDKQIYFDFYGALPNAVV